MSYGVEIYRCDETLARVETRPLAEVLRAALAGVLRYDPARLSFDLFLYQIPQPSRPRRPGPPVVWNLMPDWGYATVFAYEDGRLVYRHPHPVDEIIGDHLAEKLAAGHAPDPVLGSEEAWGPETVWGYRVVGPGLPRALRRPVPEVEGSVTVRPLSRDEAPLFRKRRVPDPDPPLATLGTFGIDGDDGGFVKVLVRDDVERLLCQERAFSDEIEEGGFLVGHVFRDEAHDGTFLVEVTGALAARHTGASLLHLTLTGDSFQDVRQTLRRRGADEWLLGWYHTHLFPASESMGLSTIDFDLHFTTFLKPWQLAGLVNLETHGGRTLRFYVRRGDTMDRCPLWVVRAGLVDETPEAMP